MLFYMFFYVIRITSVIQLIFFLYIIILFSIKKIGSIKSGFAVIEHGILYSIVTIFYSSKAIRNTNNKFNE